MTVHGVVTELSPVVCGKKNAEVGYFTSKLTDSKKMIRLISFEPKLHAEIE